MSSQSQTPLPDNHTIQKFVEDYVEEYVSKSIVELTPYGYTNFSWLALIFGQAYVFYNLYNILWGRQHLSLFCFRWTQSFLSAGAATVAR